MRKAGIVVGLVVCIGLGAVGFMSCAHVPVARGPIDVSGIPDGVYRGEHKWFPVWVTVDVTVEAGKIAKIDLVKHFKGKGGKAEKPVREQIVEKQSTQVDTVTGATRSSLVIMNAVQDAISKARKTRDGPKTGA